MRGRDANRASHRTSAVCLPGVLAAAARRCFHRAARREAVAERSPGKNRRRCEERYARESSDASAASASADPR